MELHIDDLKGVNLVDFLSLHYGLRFRREGKQFACRSPFREDKTPSFFVRMVDWPVAVQGFLERFWAEASLTLYGSKRASGTSRMPWNMLSSLSHLRWHH